MRSPQLEAIMGLMDVLRGMQYGPRGQSAPGTGTGSGTGTGTGSTGVGGTGMSPLTMAILGLLAYKAVKSMRHVEQPEMAPAGDVKQVDAPEASGGQSSGTVGGLLKGVLGGVLGGSAAGGIVSGGLNDFLRQLQQRGLGDTADSWVGQGSNRTIAPNDLAKALGADQIEAMMQHSGLSREELLDGLSKHLPEIVDRLTPEGRVPQHIPM
jgi:uncharacterized protein YidB (DUF937 family)